MWTFGASVDLQYAFTATSARWRPFVGAGAGNRLALTEASSPNPLQSRTAVTPSVNLSLEGGVSYAVARGFQIFAEVEVAHDWLVASANRMDYEKTAATATSVHPSIGVLFEY
jgi:outer membrane protein W